MLKSPAPSATPCAVNSSFYSPLLPKIEADMNLPWLDIHPHIHPSAFVESSARIVGDVTLGPEVSIWYYAVLRGDVGSIKIGARSNIQDQAVCHCTRGKYALTLGEDVSVGHQAILHGCTIGDRVLVGMGAIVMDGAEIGNDCLIGAGTLISPGTIIPPGSLVIGSPGRVKRPLRDDELAYLKKSSANYVGYASAYREAWKRKAEGLALIPEAPSHQASKT